LTKDIKAQSRKNMTLKKTVFQGKI